MEARATIKTEDGSFVTSTNPFPMKDVGNPAVSSAVSIVTGTATSGVIDLGGSCLTGIITPSELANATICILASSASDGTFVPIYTDGNSPVNIAVATNQARFVGLDMFAVAVAPARFVKIQLGTTTVSATASATRTFYLVTK